jgi:hypothetical protein
VTRYAVEGLVEVRPPRSADPYPDLDEPHAVPHDGPATTSPAVPVSLVPYFLWGNREPAAMRVWLRQS